MFLFGDSTFTVKMNATLTVEEKMLDIVDSCFLSIVYDKEAKVSPYEKASFELDLSKSDYKIIATSPGPFVFSTDTTESSLKDRKAPSFFVQQMPYKEATDEILLTVADQMIQFSKMSGISDLKLENMKMQINGNNALEISGYGKKNGSKLLFYLLAVGKQNNVIVIQGNIKSDFENNLNKMIEVTHTVILK